MASTYLIYLRKSRQDNPDESVEEVLAKHELILQEYAQRELGHTIPSDCIYREVVSGESIEDRIEIKKVLLRMENADVIGVLVVDPQRLSRGDLEDCGRLINALKWTNTLVLTPMMTYDMSNKMERRFFQDELLRGRDYWNIRKKFYGEEEWHPQNAGAMFPPFRLTVMIELRSVRITPSPLMKMRTLYGLSLICMSIKA